MANSLTCDQCGESEAAPQRRPWLHVEGPRGMYRLTAAAGPVKLDFCAWPCLVAYGQEHHAGATTTRLGPIQNYTFVDPATLQNIFPPAGPDPEL